MALDLETKLASQLGIEGDRATCQAVSRLLLSVVHDVNGRLGIAVLRSGSLQRALEQQHQDLAGGDDRLDPALLERMVRSHDGLKEGLGQMKALLEALSEAAWVLEEEG